MIWGGSSFYCCPKRPAERVMCALLQVSVVQHDDSRIPAMSNTPDPEHIHVPLLNPLPMKCVCPKWWQFNLHNDKPSNHKTNPPASVAPSPALKPPSTWAQAKAKKPFLFNRWTTRGSVKDALPVRRDLYVAGSQPPTRKGPTHNWQKHKTLMQKQIWMFCNIAARYKLELQREWLRAHVQVDCSLTSSSMSYTPHKMLTPCKIERHCALVHKKSSITWIVWCTDKVGTS